LTRSRAVRIAVVVLAALAARLAVFAAGSARGETVMASDSYGYEQLARSLLQAGRFAEPDGSAHTRRTPGFPLLIAAVYAAAGEDPGLVVLIGILLAGATAGVAALTAERLAGPRAGLAAGLLVALDCASIAGSQRLLTEVPFTALLTASAIAAASAASRPRAAATAWLGALLACAALIRPIGLPLVFVAAAWVAFLARARRLGPRDGVRLAAALLAPWLVIVGGWQVHNARHAGTWAASDGPAKYLLLSRGADVLAQRDGTSYREAREGLEAEIGEASRREGRRPESLYLGAAVSLIARHPLLFLWTQVRWLPELLLGTGAIGIEERTGLGPGWGTALRAASIAHLLLLYAAVLAGLRRAWTDDLPRRLALAYLAAASLALVFMSTGPRAYSRFRMPVVPLLAVCAGYGLAGSGRPRPVEAPSGDGQ
jgi:4-amino-4-deoxy-L-arabinose transferase-like glycosyltransferase